MDKYLDSWDLRRLEAQRQLDMEGWEDNDLTYRPSVRVHLPDDWDTPLRHDPEEVKAVAQSIRDRLVVKRSSQPARLARRVDVPLPGNTSTGLGGV